MPEETPELPVSPEEAQIEAPSFLDKLKIHKFKILTGVLGIFVFTGVVVGVYKFRQRQAQPAPQPTPTPVPAVEARIREVLDEYIPKYSLIKVFELEGLKIIGSFAKAKVAPKDVVTDKALVILEKSEGEWSVIWGPGTAIGRTDPILEKIPEGLLEESCVKAETGEEMSLSEAKEIALESECVGEGNLTDEYFCNKDTGTWWIDLDVQKEGCAPACVVNVSTGEAEINWRCTGLIPPKTEGRYVCPENNVIDCIPIIQGEKEWFCSDDYLDWAEENCPEFIIAY